MSSASASSSPGCRARRCSIPELYFLSQLPADMDSGETLVVLVVALALSFIATLIPSWRASKLDPVQALRYE
jgi:lipoprotein-releasing system permease protein